MGIAIHLAYMWIFGAINAGSKQLVGWVEREKINAIRFPKNLSDCQHAFGFRYSETQQIKRYAC